MKRATRAVFHVRTGLGLGVVATIFYAVHQYTTSVFFYDAFVFSLGAATILFCSGFMQIIIYARQTSKRSR